MSAKTLPSIAFITAVLTAHAAQAENPASGEGSLDREAIIRMLAPDAPSDEVSSSRGISVRPIKDAIEKPSQEKAVSLHLYFDYNSDRITEAAERQLRPVGQALASKELNTVNFTIEGHTDSAGSETYNKNLSERRARAVKNYLVSRYGIEPGRIQSVGKGELDLLDPQNPESGVNRRVKIVARP